MCTPMTYWANRSHAHVRARVSFLICAYRDPQSVIDRDAYATTFRSPFTSSCRIVAPSPYELASADMIKGLVASYHANVGVVHSSFLTLSMAFCWAVSHVHITSFRSNSLSGLVKEVKLGANLPIWFTMPINRCNSVTFCGAGNLDIAATFEGSALIPPSSIMKPRNLVLVLENSHLFFSVMPLRLIRSITSSTRWSCSSLVVPCITRYASPGVAC